MESAEATYNYFDGLLAASALITRTSWESSSPDHPEYRRLQIAKVRAANLHKFHKNKKIQCTNENDLRELNALYLSKMSAITSPYLPRASAGDIEFLSEPHDPNTFVLSEASITEHRYEIDLAYVLHLAKQSHDDDMIAAYYRNFYGVMAFTFPNYARIFLLLSQQYVATKGYLKNQSDKILDAASSIMKEIPGADSKMGQINDVIQNIMGKVQSGGVGGNIDIASMISSTLADPTLIENLRSISRAD